MASRAERIDLPQALNEGLREFNESEARQVELARHMLRDSVESLLGDQHRTPSTIVSSDSYDYEAYVQRTDSQKSGKVEFKIKPNVPAWASEDSLFTLDADNYVFDMETNPVEEAEKITQYINVVEFLRNKLSPS